MRRRLLRGSLVRWLGGEMPPEPRKEASPPPPPKESAEDGWPHGIESVPPSGSPIELDSDSLMENEEAKAVLQAAAMSLLDSEVRGFLLVRLTGETHLDEGGDTSLKHLGVASMISEEHVPAFCTGLLGIVRELNEGGPNMPGLKGRME